MIVYNLESLLVETFFDKDDYENDGKGLAPRSGDMKTVPPYGTLVTGASDNFDE